MGLFLVMEIKANAKKGKQPLNKSSKANSKHKSKDKNEEIEKEKKQ